MTRGYLLIVLIVAGVLAYPRSGCPEQPQDRPASVQESLFHTFPVSIDGIVLFHVRGVEAYPADERAKRIGSLIEKAAQDQSVRPDDITAVESDLSTDIVAGNRVIMSVVDADALPEGVDRQLLAKIHVGKIGEAVERYRQERTLREIYLGILWSVIAMLVLLVSLLLIRTLFRRLQEKVDAAQLADRIASIKIQSFVIVNTEQIKALLTGAVRAARFLTILLLFYVAVNLVLGFFPWTRPFSNELRDFLLAPLAAMGRGILHHVPNLIFLAALVFVANYLFKLMRLFFEGLENGAITFSGFYPEWARPTFKIASALLFAFMVVVAFPYIPGSSSPAFQGISIFLGVILSLGSSSIISNILAGLTMTYRRAFKVGDRVMIGDFRGEVTEMRLLVTHLRSSKNEEIVVPNSMIYNSHVINYSTLAKQRGLVLHTAVTIGYNIPWRQVHALLLQAAGRTPGLLPAPPPFVRQTALDEVYVRYELNAYTDSPHGMTRIYSDLHQNIQDAFNAYGVQIMTPRYAFDREPPAVVPPERWHEPPAEPPGEKNEGMP
ncbi:MAG TPA: mechanosensitive ion channel domain-containing protein [Desulfuromonadales bacterium]|nr:mechanosensitive ion channel domain-containing protein [Desulfuromonadales bacterium]